MLEPLTNSLQENKKPIEMLKKSGKNLLKTTKINKNVEKQ